MRSGLQVFRVQSATSCLQGYQPTITPNSRALGGVEGPPGAQHYANARAQRHRIVHRPSVSVLQYVLALLAPLFTRARAGEGKEQSVR